MALKKEIEMNNGVIMNYHRVTSLNVITNVQNIIEVSSYPSEAKRIQEQIALTKGESYDVFVHTEIVGVEYDQEMTIKSAYDYLKTLPVYQGAEDV